MNSTWSGPSQFGATQWFPLTGRVYFGQVGVNAGQVRTQVADYISDPNTVGIAYVNRDDGGGLCPRPQVQYADLQPRLRIRDASIDFNNRGT